jgi:hypothetical protein
VISGRNNWKPNSWVLIIESARLRRHNQLTKAIQEKTAKKHKLVDKNTPPYYRYKPEPVLESANMILCWDRSIISDKTVDFNRHDIVVIDWENKTALVIDTAVPLTHNLPKFEAEKLQNMNNLALEIKNMWKLNSVSI